MRPGVTQGRLLRQLEAEAPAERGRGGPQAQAQSGSRETLWGSWVPIVPSPVQPGSLQAASTLESSRPDGTLVLPAVSAKRKKERNTRQKKKNLFFKRTQTQPVAMGGVSTPAHCTQLRPHRMPGAGITCLWGHKPLSSIRTGSPGSLEAPSTLPGPISTSAQELWTESGSSKVSVCW